MNRCITHWKRLGGMQKVLYLHSTIFLFQNNLPTNHGHIKIKYKSKTCNMHPWNLIYQSVILCQKTPVKKRTLNQKHSFFWVTITNIQNIQYYRIFKYQTYTCQSVFMNNCFSSVMKNARFSLEIHYTYYKINTNAQQIDAYEVFFFFFQLEMTTLSITIT